MIEDRNMINILIVGDPGLAKTRLFYQAIKISTHYAIAVGKGASGVGLTASITKDDKGNPMISVGAAVLADGGGLCGIEELGNINEEYRAHLLESMESGTVTINKHGINTTLNARAAYLVTSNPDSGRYQTSLGLHDNLTISPQLLSRFDVIFVVVDKMDKKFDEKLADHIFDRFEKNLTAKSIISINDSNIDKLDHETLVEYLFYAKTHNKNNIIITEGAKKVIKSFYHDLRQVDNTSDFSATPRQLEGSIRMSLALTRLLLKNEVTEEIAIEAVDLLNNAYESAGLLIKGSSTGLKGNMIYPKNLNDMKKEKAAVEIIKYVTNSGEDPRDRDYIVTCFMKELKDMSIYDAGKLFEKIDQMGLLHVENSKYTLYK
jgi:DNA replicative helicase MCM subunit Mcm2 (Cdc46/Mcm family)